MAHPLRARLARTFQAFLGRFERPSEVQEQGIPAILDGGDVLLCAPTASGKTEAYAAPCAERLLEGPRGAASLMFVSPTRALANDLFRRLEGPMHDLGIGWGRYTGEHKERRGGVLPEAVLVTPEGLDSLLGRRPLLLESLRVLVLDEIHHLDNDARGDHLRILLHRLERRFAALPDRPAPQRIAASATVGHPEELAARYLRDARVVRVDGGRQLKATAFEGTGPGALRDHVERLAGAGLRKLLLFCNSRHGVEETAAALRGHTRFEDRVYAHHGSLSRSVRLSHERRFLEATSAVAVATLTLELGIDIGNVDYVLLVGAPPDVSSLMQRAGRGGRRGEVTRVGYATDDASERFLVRHMLRCGARGELHERPYAFRAGVLVQQALSLAGGQGWVSAETLAAVLPPDLARPFPRDWAGRLLEGLVGSGLLEPARSGRHVLAPATERQYDRGLLHANFSEPPSLQVVDRLTGDVVGHLDPRRLEGGNRDGDLRLGGAGRRVTGASGGRVLTDQASGGEAQRYAGGAGGAVSMSFARSLVEALGAPEDGMLLTPVAHRRWVLAHGLGTFGGMFLRWLFEQDPHLPTPGGSTPYTLRLAFEPSRLPRPEARDVERFLDLRRTDLARVAGLSHHHPHLPQDLLRTTLEAIVSLDPAAGFLDGARLVPVHTPEPTEVLGEL